MKKDKTLATCGKESVCYQISCDRCRETGIAADYYGESSRTPYLRGQEHLKGQALRHEDNPLHKHDSIHHLGNKGTYSMKVLRTHKQPLSRQVQEAVEIQSSKSQIIMNSKSEYNGSKLPRITIEVGDRVMTEDYRGQNGPRTTPPP